MNKYSRTVVNRSKNQAKFNPHGKKKPYQKRAYFDNWIEFVMNCGNCGGTILEDDFEYQKIKDVVVCDKCKYTSTYSQSIKDSKKNTPFTFDKPITKQTENTMTDLEKKAEREATRKSNYPIWAVESKKISDNNTNLITDLGAIKGCRDKIAKAEDDIEHGIEEQANKAIASTESNNMVELEKGIESMKVENLLSTVKIEQEKYDIKKKSLESKKTDLEESRKSISTRLSATNKDIKDNDKQEKLISAKTAYITKTQPDLFNI
jgi:hypothetical protein